MQKKNHKMKTIKTISLMLVIFISTSSFTTFLQPTANHCVYKMYNSKGEYLGTWDIYVPSNISCGSKEAKALAIAEFNIYG